MSKAARDPKNQCSYWRSTKVVFYCFWDCAARAGVITWGPPSALNQQEPHQVALPPALLGDVILAYLGW